MRLQITMEGRSYEVDVEVLPDAAGVSDEDCSVAVPDSVLRPPLRPDTREVDKICRSPIAGTIVSVETAVGMRVRENDPVAIINAMKMETTVGAPMDGIVEEVAVTAGAAVKPGQVLCRLA